MERSDHGEAGQAIDAATLSDLMADGADRPAKAGHDRIAQPVAEGSRQVNRSTRPDRGDEEGFEIFAVPGEPGKGREQQGVARAPVVSGRNRLCLLASSLNCGATSVSSRESGLACASA